MTQFRRIGARSAAEVAAGLAALGAAAAILAALTRLPDPTLPAVFGVAAVLGFVFIRYDYGFTASFRRFLADGDGRALAASLAVPAVASLIIIPVGGLADGYSRFLAPVGPSLVVGAFLFGIGMQTANACGSGTVIAFGQGSRRALVALPFFCLGGVLGTLVLPWALSLPGFGVIDLVQRLGVLPALAATQAGLLAAALLILRGQSPAWARVRLSALVGLLVGILFLMSREPWGITLGLTVWGAKVLKAAGLDVGDWPFWHDAGARALLDGPWLGMHGALTNAGLMVGALLAAAGGGRLRLGAHIGRRSVAGAVFGGLLMGIGARLSFGCNIGAFLGGVTSGSLHGAVWFLAALPGCRVGIWLRPLFGFADQTEVMKPLPATARIMT